MSRTRILSGIGRVPLTVCAAICFSAWKAPRLQRYVHAIDYSSLVRAVTFGPARTLKVVHVITDEGECHVRDRPKFACEACERRAGSNRPCEIFRGLAGARVDGAARSSAPTR